MSDIQTGSTTINADKTFRVVYDYTPAVKLIFFGDKSMRMIIEYSNSRTESYDLSAKQAKDICTAINEYYKVYE